MTGVPRLQHLPVPTATAGGTAVAVPDASGGQRVKPLLPVQAFQRGHSQAQRGGRGDGRDGVEERVRQGPEQTPSLGGRSEAAAGRPLNVSRLTAMPFLVQLLGQQGVIGRGQATMPQTCLTGHRDAALLGSDVYRRAGGEPEILPDTATFVRLAV